MDKYEYRVRTEQMLEYMENKSYGKAMEIADTIDWRRVKNSSMLSSVSEIYEYNGEYKKSRDILFIAYDRAPGSRKIVYRLGILALKLNEINEATDCYEEFVTLAPKDPNQYILRYKILKAQRAPIEQQIETLEDFKKAEYVEKWAYELAKLYHEAGMTAECLEECDDLILWFSEGKYVYQAMELKMRYKPLTPLQQEKFNHRYDAEAKTPAFKKPVVEKRTVSRAASNESTEEQTVGEPSADDEMPELNLKKPVFKKPEFRKAEIKTVTGATLAEALANGVALASKADDEDNYEEAELETEDAEDSYEEAELELEPEESYEEAVLEEDSYEEAELELEEDEDSYEEAELEVDEADEIEEPEEHEVKLAESPMPEPEDEPLVAGQITGQMKIEEILQNWEAKQKEVQKEIQVKKHEAEVEKRTSKKVKEPETDDIEALLNDLDLDALGGEEEPAEKDYYEEAIEEPESDDDEYEEIEFNTAAEDEEPVEDSSEEDEYVEIKFDDKDDEYEEITFENKSEDDYEEGFIDDDTDDDFIEEDDDTDDDFIEEEAEPEDEEEEEEMDLQRLLEEGDDDYKKPKGRGPYDTGFVVQGRYDLSATSEIGLKAGLTEDQKKLFSYFVPVRGMSEQLVEVLAEDKACKTRYGTSRTGNLLVVGRKGMGKTVLAVDVVKAVQKQRKLKQAKVAIVTGEALNQKALSGVLSKLHGGAIIIEKAGKMNSRTVKELNELMEEQTGELYVVLEDQRKPLEAMLKAHPDFKKKFTSKLELPIFINDELVTFGQTYAKENGYKIDEMGILALYSRIDMMQREDHAVTVAEVKDIMDEAIEHCQKGNVKHLMKRVFGKNSDESDRIYLHEEDFNSSL